MAGAGTASTISGPSVTYAGGGGGGWYQLVWLELVTDGSNQSGTATDGLANTGGGGGGSGDDLDQQKMVAQAAQES
jgi:hypothetical protein